MTRHVEDLSRASTAWQRNSFWSGMAVGSVAMMTAASTAYLLGAQLPLRPAGTALAAAVVLLLSILIRLHMVSPRLGLPAEAPEGCDS